MIILSCLSLCTIIFYVLYPYFSKDVDPKFLSEASVNGLLLSCVNHKIFKWNKTKKREDIEAAFLASASNLDSMYTKYLADLNK